MQELTVKDLRIALIGVPDDLPVRLSSDTGVDQGLGEITVEKARRVKYGDEDYFEIFLRYMRMTILRTMKRKTTVMKMYKESLASIEKLRKY